MENSLPLDLYVLLDRDATCILHQYLKPVP